jgi:hypothetical protein
MVKVALLPSFVLWLATFVVAGPSTSCTGYYVVPGSLFDYAYSKQPNQTTYYNASAMCTDSNANATLPIFRDTVTGPYLANITAWFIVGLYQQNTSFPRNNSGFVWADNVSAALRTPNWYTNNLDYDQSCVYARPNGLVQSLNCTSKKDIFCEISSKELFNFPCF